MNFESSKRSQTTIFIILAIVIVAVVVGVFLISRVSVRTDLDDTFSKLGITSQASAVQSSIFECIEQTSQDALTFIGIQGGYYNNPNRYFDLSWAIIPYYYDKGDFLMPGNEVIQNELGLYVDDNLDFCLDELPYDDFTIKYRSSKTGVLIGNKDVSFTVDSRITFEKSGLSSEFEIGKYPVEIESALSDILEVADYITESHREDPDFICISCVADMAEIRNLYVDMIDFGDEQTTLVVISENYTSADPYIFEFLNRYPEEVFEDVPV